MTWDWHTLREDEGHSATGATERKHSLAEHSTAEHSTESRAQRDEERPLSPTRHSARPSQHPIPAVRRAGPGGAAGAWLTGMKGTVKLNSVAEEAKRRLVPLPGFAAAMAAPRPRPFPTAARPLPPSSRPPLRWRPRERARQEEKGGARGKGGFGSRRHCCGRSERKRRRRRRRAEVRGPRAGLASGSRRLRGAGEAAAAFARFSPAMPCVADWLNSPFSIVQGIFGERGAGRGRDLPGASRREGRGPVPLSPPGAAPG